MALTLHAQQTLSLGALIRMQWDGCEVIVAAQ